MTSELSVFASRLRDLIPLWLEDHGTDAEFNSYALLLFALQYRANRSYRKLCEARGVAPDSLTHWVQIPAVPTSAFKDYEVTCLPTEERTAVFHSSGTTGQRPSQHFHSAESLEMYEASLWPWFQRHVVPEFRVPSSSRRQGYGGQAGFRVVALSPAPAQAPHSSLVHMFEVVRRRVEAPETIFYGGLGTNGAWNLDCEKLTATLREADARPVILLGTAFSFVHLLDYLAENDLPLTLSAGSGVIETGGYKGRSRTIPKAELHALITQHLGVPSSHIVCEYGMSELSSQAYDFKVTGVGCRVSGAILRPPTSHFALRTSHFKFPPWARAQIVSPETGREVGEGETGLVRIFDLANVYSVMALQTEDLAVRRGDGFELVGRATEAEPRGCSLMSVENH